jgi:hypothetical protein
MPQPAGKPVPRMVVLLVVMMAGGARAAPGSRIHSLRMAGKPTCSTSTTTTAAHLQGGRGNG